MKSRLRNFSTVRRAACCALAVWLVFAAANAPLTAGIFFDKFLVFDTELQEFDLSGGPFPMPLASDPGNLLGDSVEGYGFVDSQVQVTLSSQRAGNPGPPSLGQACAFAGEPSLTAAAVGRGCPADPPPLTPQDILDFDGMPFFVDSFFDVFFDITVTDVDSRDGRDFAGMPDGASIVLQDTGPAEMISNYDQIFDKDAPNFGLIPPPEVAPYIGHVTIEIPLGGDINGNGEDDKIKFQLVTHAAGDENRTFIQLPDGTVLDTFDSAALLEGAVVDVSTDPPFTIGATLPNGLPDPSVFGGPTTASSKLMNVLVPEPSSLLLLALGILGLASARRFAGK